jgi:hypothetical protein
MKMTPSSELALQGLRDLSTIKWYVIPMLSFVFYVYTAEIQKARRSGNWDAIFAGLTLFGMVLFNETWNGWIFHHTQHSAFWTAPGETALRITVGSNIEILFMFTVSGIVFYNTLSDNRDAKTLGLPDRWFWAIGYTVFCLFIECLLNLGGHLVWEYPYWNLSFKGIWLILLIGYFHFYVAIILVLALKSIKSKIIAVSSIYAFTITANIITFGFLGWFY